VVEDLPLDKGGTFAWKYADPCELLMMVVSEAPLLSECFKHAAARSPPSRDRPWSLVLAWDEFCPGNKLQVDPSRKAMVLSFTFLELGQDCISNGLAWITPVVVRTAILRKVTGAWPNFLRRFLRRILVGPNGLASVGMPLVLADGTSLPLFANVAGLLSDGDGLRAGLDWKGHAGLKPCLRHYNVWKLDIVKRASLCSMC